MARIPDPSSRERVAVRPSMDVASYNAPSNGLQVAGQQIQHVGEMIQRESDRIADSQAAEAKSQLRNTQVELTMGQPDPATGQGGFVYDKGTRVMVAGEGEKPFIERHQERFKAARESIGAKLTGRAREEFDRFADAASGDFQAGLLKHAVIEADGYHKQQFENTLASESAAAATQWDNPKAVVGSLNNVTEAAKREAERLGLPPEGVARKAQAEVHESIIKGALSSGTPEGARFAEEHLANYKELLGDKLLPLSNSVQAVRKQHIAFTAADAVIRDIQPRLNPTETDRAMATIPMVESGDQHFDKTGKVVVSPAGAVGRWQVMPATGPEAAKAAGVPWSEERMRKDPKYNETLGKAYFRKMLTAADGDVEKAWAAYNAGPGALRKAEKAEEEHIAAREKDPSIEAKTWLDFMPAETQGYVKKNKAAFDRGVTAPEPTLEEVRDMARRRVLADNPKATLDQVEAAQVKAEQWFNDARTAKNQRQDNVLKDLQQRIFAGEIKSAHDLSPEDLAQVGDKRHVIEGYLKAAQAEQDRFVNSDPATRELYDRMASSPAILAEMPVSKVMEMSPIIGKKWADELLKKRADYVASPEKFEQAKIDADEFAVITTQLGIKGNGDDAVARRHFIRQRAEEEIGRLRASGQKPDKYAIIAKYARQYVTEEGTFFDTKKYGYELQDPMAESVIPASELKKMARVYEKLGVKMPDDPAARASVYYRWKDATAKEKNTP